nr:hypothetical protein [Tanacetum cinerariifolium]
MPPRMMTQSAGRPAATSRGGGMSGRAGRGGCRIRGCSGDQGNDRIDGQGGQVGGQGSEVNDGVNGVPDFSTIIAQQLQNLLSTIVAQVGGQEAAIGMSWEDFKTLTREEFCPSFMIWLEPKTIQKAIQIAGTLTDEALRNRSIQKNHEKRGNRGELSKDMNVRDDNKRTMTGNAYATTTNPVRRENTSTVPKCTTCKTHHPPEAPCHTRFNCNCLGHFAKDCRMVPRNVNPIKARNLTIRACYECASTDDIRSACPRLNRAQGPRGNCPTQVLANNEGQGHGNQGNQARGRAFMLKAEEACQDPNIVTGMFTLNDHYATTLFDSGANYSFVSSTFIPLLGIEPNDLGFSY